MQKFLTRSGMPRYLLSIHRKPGHTITITARGSAGVAGLPALRNKGICQFRRITALPEPFIVQQTRTI